MKHVWILLACGVVSVNVSALRANEDAGAASLIPFDALSESNRFLVQAVTDYSTLRREYTEKQFRSRVRIFEHLLDNMDACAALANKLGLIKYRVTRDEHDRLHADDREGAAGSLLNVYATDGKRVFYVEGAQRGLFTVHGRGVAVVEYRQIPNDTIEYTGAVFVKVDNKVLAVLAKIFAVFVQGTVDSHFRNVIRNPIKVSEIALADPNGLLEHIRQMSAEDRKLLAPLANLLASTQGDVGNQASPSDL